jgi:hypothetical protein
MGKTARNEITHDKIKTKPQNDKYATGWERIFGNKETDNDNDNDNKDGDRDSGSSCGS